MDTSEYLSLIKAVKPDFVEKNETRLQVSSSTQARLVLDFLLNQGYYEAAKALVKDASLEWPQNVENDVNRKIRTEVRETIMQGEINSAIKIVNNLDPEILKESETLHFHLKKQALIELIRKSEVGKAIKYAQDHVSPLAEDSDDLRQELEEVMSLLVFGEDLDSPVKYLFSSDNRRETAFELNAAILRSEKKKDTPDLVKVMKLLVLTQNEMKAKAGEKMDFPEIDFHV